MKIVQSHSITEGLQGLPIPIPDHLYVEPIEESGILSKILSLPHNCFFSPARETKYPGILINTFGKGRVVYFAFAFGKFYRDHGIVEYRKLLENAVRWASRDGTPIDIEAPSSVTMYLFEQPNRLIIHLVDGATDAGEQVEKGHQEKGNSSSYLNVLHNIQVSVRVPDGKQVQEVASVSKGTKLRFRKVNHQVLFTIPRLAEYNLIIVEYR